jgi:hypothetical protein
MGEKGVQVAVEVREPEPFPKEIDSLFYDRLWIVLYPGTADDDSGLCQHLGGFQNLTALFF